MSTAQEKKPRITYLLATFNREKFLRPLFANLREFITPEDELIVIDGASTDGSLDIIRENMDLIDVLISEPDIGEAHAFNKGFLIARGEVLKFLTDDDYFYPERMKQAAAYILAHPEIDALICRGEFYSGHGHIHPEKGFPIDVPYNSSFKYVYRYRALSGIGMFFRRRTLAVVGLLDVKWRAVDYAFINRYFVHKLDIRYYDLKIYRHTQHADSGMTKFKQGYNRDIVRILWGHKLYWQALIRIPRFGTSIPSKLLYRILEPIDRAIWRWEEKRLPMRKPNPDDPAVRSTAELTGSRS